MSDPKTGSLPFDDAKTPHACSDLSGNFNNGEEAIKARNGFKEMLLEFPAIDGNS